MGKRARWIVPGKPFDAPAGARWFCRVVAAQAGDVDVFYGYSRQLLCPDPRSLTPEGSVVKEFKIQDLTSGGRAWARRAFLSGVWVLSYAVPGGKQTGHTEVGAGDLDAAWRETCAAAGVNVAR